MGFRVWGLRSTVQGSGFRMGFTVTRSNASNSFAVPFATAWFRVEGLGLRVQGLGFRV